MWNDTGSTAKKRPESVTVSLHHGDNPNVIIDSTTVTGSETAETWEFSFTIPEGNIRDQNGTLYQYTVTQSSITDDNYDTVAEPPKWSGTGYTGCTIQLQSIPSPAVINQY